MLLAHLLRQSLTGDADPRLLAVIADPQRACRGDLDPLPEALPYYRRECDDLLTFYPNEYTRENSPHVVWLWRPTS